MPPLLEKYESLFSACVVNPSRSAEINGIITHALLNKNRYLVVTSTLNSQMPWWFVAVIHSMECSLRFDRHLHNGDPLTAKTVHVPADRPLIGQPPFTWEQSAIDALKMKQLHLVSDWSIPNILYLLEKYNGMGYQRRNINSPYLWSATNQYTKGKFIVDGHFDPDTVSKQCGAAAIIKTMEGQNITN